MGLDKSARQQAKRVILDEAKVSPRFHNRPLSTAGKDGVTLRTYMKEKMLEARNLSRGLVFVSEGSGIAQSFARDMAIAKTGIRFSYLQTFATYHASEEFAYRGHVLEWFEQKGQATSPYSAKERYVLETEILRMMDNGKLFYLFTQVPPMQSVWWSKSFWDTVAETNDIIFGGTYGGRENGERTSIGNSADEKRKGVKPAKRVTIR